MEVLDELNETLELSGAKLGQAHARLPLYRAPSLDLSLIHIWWGMEPCLSTPIGRVKHFYPM